MGNGTRLINSGQVEGLYKRIMRHQPQYRHYTIQKKYMVGVVGSPHPEILIYDLERSIKPLMRVVEQGTKTVIRDYYNLGDGINVLQHLDRIVEQQAKKSMGVTEIHREVLETPQVSSDVTGMGLFLNPEGKVVLGKFSLPGVR